MRRRSIGVIAVVVLLPMVAAGLLALDLANRGLAWRAFYALTGEEAPLAQVRGMIEWVGNATRSMPDTQPYAVLDHPTTAPYGINTFLQLEVDPAIRERSLQMIADAGFNWIRQQFPWEDIEIHRRGDFEDRRNVAAIGVVSAWDKYDQIVDLATQYGIAIQARVDTPPRWTRANPDEGTLAPPDDWEDYYTFLRITAERYRGRILHYQIWNEPNIFPEWGNNPVDPEAYSEVLCRAYATLKAVDPNIIVHSAALSPTVSLTPSNLSDLIFLQRMYDAGVGGCFDVMSVQGYGFFSGPTDQRLRSTTLNYSRPLYVRDVMVANGDAETPIWISEAAWNPVDSPEVPDIPGKENFGSVTPGQAAAYMPLAYERAQREMPWVGVIMYWYWKRPSEDERGQPFYYFRMVNPDFTPMPIYEAMRTSIMGEVATLYKGVHQADHRAIGGDGVSETMPSAQLGTAQRVNEVTFQADGTHVLIRWRDAEALSVTRDAETTTVTAPADAEGWHTATIHESRITTSVQFQVRAETPFSLDSVSVFDRTLINLMTPIAAVVLVMGFGIGLVVMLISARGAAHA